MVLRVLFVLWVVAVAVLSVISYPVSNDLLVSVKVTSSGFVMHGIAYFVGIFLCYFAFDKKNISFVLWAGLLIFLYGVVLEGIQFYLPYRTFNVYDVAANGVGVVSFVLIWTFFLSHRRTQTDTDFCPADIAGQK